MAEQNPNFTNSDPERNRFVGAVKLFDEYAFLGNKHVGFHVLKTSAGLVLFDTTDQDDGDRQFLQPGLQELGWEKEPVVMIFLTHAHHDHYMGAENVRKRTGCQVALSREDALFLVSGPDNFLDIPDRQIPRITRLVEDGEDLIFGDHTVHVIGAPGHTPGCLNYSFEVHDGGEAHRVIMMGGYGIFGPGRYPAAPAYPYSVTYAVGQALEFATSCVKTWEYCKEMGGDVYINPHPHLCELLELAEKNKSRKPGEPNALVIGVEGVRRWIQDRYDESLNSAQLFTDLQKEYQENKG